MFCEPQDHAKSTSVQEWRIEISSAQNIKLACVWQTSCVVPFVCHSFVCRFTLCVSRILPVRGSLD
jgi:hypothetical protein